MRALAFRCPRLRPDQLQSDRALTLSARRCVYDQVTGSSCARATIDHAELVGLFPEAVLRIEDPSRWEQLGLSENATIEVAAG